MTHNVICYMPCVDDKTISVGQTKWIYLSNKQRGAERSKLQYNIEGRGKKRF